MTQYCRYCAYCQTIDGICCELSYKPLTEKSAKNPNKCKHFILNRADAFYKNPRLYEPRKIRRRKKCSKLYQISLFGNIKEGVDGAK